MRTLSSKEWGDLYVSLWRAPFAELCKEERGKLVRGCKGKAIYDNREEAWAVAATLPPRGGGWHLGVYVCPLCHGLHIGNSRKSGGFRAKPPGRVNHDDHQGKVEEIRIVSAR